VLRYASFGLYSLTFMNHLLQSLNPMMSIKRPIGYKLAARPQKAFRNPALCDPPLRTERCAVEYRVWKDTKPLLLLSAQNRSTAQHRNVNLEKGKMRGQVRVSHWTEGLPSRHFVRAALGHDVIFSLDNPRSDCLSLAL